MNVKVVESTIPLAPLAPLVPLALWENDNSEHERLVWYSRLDQKFQVEVHRIDDRSGCLIIFDHVNQMSVIYTEHVDLSYGAVFGPDVADVRYWEDKVCSVVDAL